MRQRRYLIIKLPFFFLFLSLIVFSIIPSNVFSSGAVATKAGNKYRIITKRDCSLYYEPDTSSERAPCRVFNYWYVLSPDKDNSLTETDNHEELEINGFYRVASGDSESEFRGYISVEDAELWTHQQVVKLTSRQGRDWAYFYPTLKDTVNALESDNSSQATHREPESTGGELILMPVMEVKDITIKNEKMKCFETAFMAAPIAALTKNTTQNVSSETQPTYDGKPLTKERVRKETSVDLVFVVDTTSSTTPIIPQVKKSIAKVTKRLKSNSELGRRIRFGLIAYRDTVGIPNRLEYTAKIFCNLEEGRDHEYFLQRLDDLKDAETGSMDYPEDVLAGLKLAMDLEALNWNPVGWKQIIIVGDSSIKEPNHPNPESRKNQDNISISQIKAMAQPGSGKIDEKLKSDFVISVVYVQDPDWGNDHPVGEKQYRQLVAGRIYNGELIIAQGGINPEDFSPNLIKNLNESFGSFGLSVLGQSGTISSPSTQSAALYPYPVLDLIKELETGTASGINFAHRFTTEFDSKGNRVLVPHLWVRKGDLKAFNSLLEYLVGQLEDAGDPGSKDIKEVLNGLKIISTTINLNEPITPEMPIDRFLKLLGGFPLKSKIFHYSIHEIAAMSQTDYNDWVKSIKTCMETVDKLSENPNIWFKLHPQAKDREEHAFIAMADLP